MAAATSLLFASAASQGFSSVGGAYAQSQAQRAQGDVTKTLFDENSKFADLQADDAIRRGNTAAMEAKRRTDDMVGTQRAGFAGQGVDVNSGSAAEVQGDTRAMGALDMVTLKNNAYREAMGYRVSALDYNFRGNMAKMAGDNEASQTMLTGGLRALQSGLEAGYYGFGGGKKTKY